MCQKGEEIFPPMLSELHQDDDVTAEIRVINDYFPMHATQIVEVSTSCAGMRISDPRITPICGEIHRSPYEGIAKPKYNRALNNTKDKGSQLDPLK